MSSSDHRPAPPLLDETARGMRVFDEFFRPHGVPREIQCPEGRIASFAAKNLGAYMQFFKPTRSGDFGRPEQRAHWIEDTLQNPDEIRSESATAAIRTE